MENLEPKNGTAIKACLFCSNPFLTDSLEYRLHLAEHLKGYSGKSVCPECRTDCGTYEKMEAHYLSAHGKVVAVEKVGEEKEVKEEGEEKGEGEMVGQTKNEEEVEARGAGGGGSGEPRLLTVHQQERRQQDNKAQGTEREKEEEEVKVEEEKKVEVEVDVEVRETREKEDVVWQGTRDDHDDDLEVSEAQRPSQRPDIMAQKKEEEEDQNIISKQSCHFCFQQFDAESETLRSHLLNHLEDYSRKSVCPECRVDCSTNASMVDHFMMVHGKLDKLVCNFANCVRTFRTEKSLHLHAKKHLKM